LVKSNLEIEELLKEGQQHKSNGNSIPELLSYVKALELTDKTGNLMKKVKTLCFLGEYFEEESSKVDSENLKTHLDFLIRAYKLLNEIEENKDYQDYKLKVCLRIAVTYSKLDQLVNCRAYLEECQKILDNSVEKNIDIQNEM
jgi:hypothetical protein